MKRKGILITRGLGEGAIWGRYLKRKYKTDVYYLPTIKLSPVPLTVAQRKVLARLTDFDWIIFTSRAAPPFLLQLLKKYKAVPPPGRMPPIAMLGGVSEPQKVLKSIRGSVLLLRTTIASRELPRKLRALGARVTDIAIYKTESITRPDARIAKIILRGGIGHIIFASPSAVEGFAKRMRGDALKAARMIPAIAIGPKTGHALGRAGFVHIRVAETPSIEGMAAVLKRF